MTSLISFDPGYATGIASGFFDDDTPLQWEGSTIVPYDQWAGAWLIVSERRADKAVAEDFTVHKKEVDVTPIKVNGTLELLFGEDLAYRAASTKEQVPDQLLKDLGWWVTGEDVDWEDGRDANDATIHLLGYVAFDLNHLPTLREYFR